MPAQHDNGIDFVVGIGTSNPKNRAEYNLYANGYLYPHDDSLEANDTIVGQHKVEGGVVAGGWDYYGVQGWVSGLKLRPSAMVTLNGEQVSRQELLDYRPARVGGGGAGQNSGGGDGTGSAGDHRPDDEPIERGENVSVQTGTRASHGNDPNSPYTYTTGPFVRVLDPQDGDDTWPGTPKDPLKTIQEYLDRLPLLAQHTAHGITRKGAYNEGALHMHPVIKAWDGNKGGLRIGPDVEIGKNEHLPRRDREDIVVNARQINAQVWGYATPNQFTFHNMKINGALQNRWGQIAARYVTFDPVPMASGMKRAYDCYGGFGFLWDCDFAAGTHHVANLAQHGQVELRRCSLDDPSALRSVINLQGATEAGVHDGGGNDLGKFNDWFN